MPAGGHEVLGRIRKAVEQRANLILAQLQDFWGERHTEVTLNYSRSIVWERTHPGPRPIWKVTANLLRGLQESPVGRVGE